jgi:hypothetical protein
MAYVALFILNAALVALSQPGGLMQPSSAQLMHLASLVVAALMKSFSEDDAPSLPPPAGGSNA